MRVVSVAGGIPMAAACAEEPWPSPPPVPLEQLTTDHLEWREYRRGRLVTPVTGAVLWIGLHELRQGANPFGSDSALRIVLPPADAPPLAGTLHRDGQVVTLEPAPGSPISIREGAGITEAMVLGSDRSDAPTSLALGSLGLRVHGEPGTDRLWLRVWDEDMPERETFRLPEFFPVDTAWRVTARFEPFSEPRTIRLADVTGGIIQRRAPGRLVFRKDGREHSLIAVADTTSTSYFVMMWDSTATRTTYQAGRYLSVPLADEGGWTVIDFNRAYNAPCVFTAYSVCSLPPRENWLSLAVTAGEHKPAVPAY